MQWVGLILVGLVGQLAWVIENNQINLWVYSQTHDAGYVNWMTTASAIMATVTTFLMGALSDKLGKRKIFICGGYMIWGVTVFLFGLISYQNMSIVVPMVSSSIMVGVMMVIMDCMMTFFGSTANDACFNAYVTDTTNPENRGKVESVLSVLPLVANILIVGALMVFGATSLPEKPTDLETDAASVAPAWFYFFLAFGILVFLAGLAAIWLLPKEEKKPKPNQKYWASLIYGFKPKVIKYNKKFYIALLTFMAFNTAVDAFLPYYMIYFQNETSTGGLGYSGDNIIYFYVALLTILLCASIVTIIIGYFMEKIGKMKLLFTALGLSILGFLLMYFAKDVVFVTISGFLMMTGYLIGTAVLGAILRNETPVNEVGLFQGVRMIFAVMLPMIIGSNISTLIFNLSGGTYFDSGMQQTMTAPNSNMFLVSLGFMVVAIAPSIWLLKVSQKEPDLKEETKQ